MSLGLGLLAPGRAISARASAILKTLVRTTAFIKNIVPGRPRDLPHPAFSVRVRLRAPLILCSLLFCKYCHPAPSIATPSRAHLHPTPTYLAGHLTPTPILPVQSSPLPPTFCHAYVPLPAPSKDHLIRFCLLRSLSCQQSRCFMVVQTFIPRD